MMFRYLLSGRSIVYLMQMTKADDFIIRDYYFSDVEVISVVIFSPKSQTNVMEKKLTHPLLSLKSKLL